MNSTQSSDKKLNKLGHVLKRFAEKQDLKFCCNGEPLSTKELFSASGFLSLFLADAKENYEKIANGLYTHKELMEPLHSTEKKVFRKMTAEQYNEEEKYLSSQSITYRFPIIFIMKEKSYVSVVPFVDPKRKFSTLIMAGFCVESLLDYAKTYKNNKSLLIDDMIPIEPLYEKVSLDIKNKKIVILPNSMLNQFEKQENMITPYEIKDNDQPTSKPESVSELFDTDIENDDFEARINAIINGN